MFYQVYSVHGIGDKLDGSQSDVAKAAFCSISLQNRLHSLADLQLLWEDTDIQASNTSEGF